jgi:aldehyde dehydrogenase (NAD+)
MLMETERRVADTLFVYEPIGVCGLITPWNWPMNQLTVKVAPAIAAGCSMVVKPSEFSPLSALLFAEVMEEARTPPGVFNLINGSGPVVGNALATHPDIAMVSFTGLPAEFEPTSALPP